MNDRWYDDYVGREYIIDVYDCVHLVVDIQQNVFGNKFEVPVERQNHLVNKSKQINEHLDEFLYPIESDEARDGDMLLMKCKGVLNHTGIIAVHNNVKYVVHNLRNIKSVAMHRIRDLDKYFLEIEGYYRFKNEEQ